MHGAFGKGLFLTAVVTLTAATGTSDTLTLNDGRQITGYYEGGNSRTIRFRTETGTWEYDLLSVARIRIDGASPAADAAPPRVEYRDRFLPDEVQLIRVWFSSRSNLRTLPPGLAKRESLPPGLARQVRRNGSLPPGLQRRIQPLPWDLERQLPPIHTSTRRVVIGGSVVLMNDSTSVILDVIADVF